MVDHTPALCRAGFFLAIVCLCGIQTALVASQERLGKVVSLRGLDQFLNGLFGFFGNQLRTGDIIAVELQPRQAFYGRTDGNVRMEGTYGERKLLDFNIIVE